MSEQDRVRRLLGDVRATDDATPPAMPDDLAARLDARLADAARDGDPGEQAHPPAAVVPLRRRLAPVLVAAAVVLVAGGVVVGLGQGSGDEAATSDAAGGSAAEPQTSPEQAPEQAPEQTPDDPAPETLAPRTPRSGVGDTTTRMTPAPYLTERDLDAGARALVQGGEVATGDDPQQDTVARERVEGSGCAVPDADLGAATLVSLDGEPAVLVVAPVDADQQVVAVLDCLGREVGTTAVPAS